jgi:hypothetical protein
MKKVSQKEPSKASLRAMPEVDFSRGPVRRNRLLPRMLAEGYTYPGPGGKPIRVTPEEVEERVLLRLQQRVGHPKKGEEVGPTTTRSIRFPKKVWAELEKRAKKEGKPLHAAMRAVLLDWLKTG